MLMLNILNVQSRKKLLRKNGEKIFFKARPCHQHSQPLCWTTLIILFCCTHPAVNASTCPQLSHVSRDNLHKLSVAINDLSLNLYRSMSANSSENFFYSPLSISTAFELIFYGSSGSTAEELRNVLGYNRASLPTPLVHLSFRDLLCSFEDNNNNNIKPKLPQPLTLANAILVDQNLHVWPSYKEDVGHLYQALVREVDFNRNSQVMVQEINHWVKGKTDGQIDKLVDRLNGLAAMVLLNAVHFKGQWQQKFDMSDTKPVVFYNYGMESRGKQVPMMRTTHVFRQLVTREFQALELPYNDNQTSMLVLLPQRVSLLEFERILTPGLLQGILKSLHPASLRVVMPKFKFNYETELSQDLKKLGANRIFDAGFADFSKMTPSRQAYVSRVLHKVSVEVNEEGSEAAAATAITIASRSMPAFFVADHPFIFLILDKASGVILLLGRVTNL